MADPQIGSFGPCISPITADAASPFRRGASVGVHADRVSAGRLLPAVAGAPYHGYPDEHLPWLRLGEAAQPS